MSEEEIVFGDAQDKDEEDDDKPPPLVSRSNYDSDSDSDDESDDEDHDDRVENPQVTFQPKQTRSGTTYIQGKNKRRKPNAKSNRSAMRQKKRIKELRQSLYQKIMNKENE